MTESNHEKNFYGFAEQNNAKHIKNTIDYWKSVIDRLEYEPAMLSEPILDEEDLKEKKLLYPGSTDRQEFLEAFINSISQIDKEIFLVKDGVEKKVLLEEFNDLVCCFLDKEVVFFENTISGGNLVWESEPDKEKIIDDMLCDWLVFKYLIEGVEDMTSVKKENLKKFKLRLTEIKKGLEDIKNIENDQL